MRTSSLDGHYRKYDVLDENKLDQIRDIILRMYQPKDGGGSLGQVSRGN